MLLDRLGLLTRSFLAVQRAGIEPEDVDQAFEALDPMELDQPTYLVTFLTPIMLLADIVEYELTFYINALYTNLVSVGTSGGTLLAQAEDGLTVQIDVAR